MDNRRDSTIRYAATYVASYRKLNVATVTDASGNVNNIIVVKEEAPIKIEPIPENGKLVDGNELIQDMPPKPRQPSADTINSKSASTTDTTTVETSLPTSSPPIIPVAEADEQETRSKISVQESITSTGADGGSNQCRRTFTTNSSQTPKTVKTRSSNKIADRFGRL